MKDANKSRKLDVGTLHAPTSQPGFKRTETQGVRLFPMET